MREGSSESVAERFVRRSLELTERFQDEPPLCCCISEDVLTIASLNELNSMHKTVAQTCSCKTGGLERSMMKVKYKGQFTNVKVTKQYVQTGVDG